MKLNVGIPYMPEQNSFYWPQNIHLLWPCLIFWPKLQLYQSALLQSHGTSQNVIKPEKMDDLMIHLVYVIWKCSEYISPEQSVPWSKSQCFFFPQLACPAPSIYMVYGKPSLKEWMMGHHIIYIWKNTIYFTQSFF